MGIATLNGALPTNLNEDLIKKISKAPLPIHEPKREAKRLRKTLFQIKSINIAWSQKVIAFVSLQTLHKMAKQAYS